MGPGDGPGPEPAGFPSGSAATDPDAAPRRRAVIGLVVVAGFGGVVAAFSALSLPSVSDETVRRALDAALVRGPRDGAWTIQEPEGERQRDVASAPDPSRVLVRFGVDAKDKVVSFPREYVAARAFGEGPLALFLANYRAERRRPRDDVEGRRAVRVRWVSALLDHGPTRTLWIDAENGDVLRLEDRAHDGALVHAARWLSPDPRGPDLAQAQAMPGEARRRKPPSFEDVVAAAPFPVYEPARLPSGFQRVSQTLVTVSLGVGFGMGPRGLGLNDTAEVVVLRYSDGLAELALSLLAAKDLRRIERMSRARPMRPRAEACPGAEATIEELLASADELVVRRHSDRCGTVLKVDDIGGTAVLLRARNELPPEAYVAAIESLAPAAGSKTAEPGSRSVEEWMQPASGSAGGGGAPAKR